MFVCLYRTLSGGQWCWGCCGNDEPGLYLGAFSPVWLGHRGICVACDYLVDAAPSGRGSQPR